MKKMFQAFLLVGVLIGLVGCSDVVSDVTNQAKDTVTETVKNTADDVKNKATEEVNKAKDEVSKQVENVTNPEPIKVDRANTVDATVVKVKDGDTLDVNVDGKVETIRLLLVDTPETVHEKKPIQTFGPEASAFTKETFPKGKKVQVEYDKNRDDKFKRTVAYVYVDGKMFNETLVEKGYARVAYVYPPNTKHLKELQNVEAKAKQQKIGIWSIPNYVQKDGFHQEVVK